MPFFTYTANSTLVGSTQEPRTHLKARLKLRTKKTRSSISLPTMQDSVYNETSASIIDRKQNSVITDSQAITRNTGELLHLRTARVHRQLLDAEENEATLLGWDTRQVLLDASVVREAVHALDDPLPLQALKQPGVGDRATPRLDGLFESD